MEWGDISDKGRAWMRDLGNFGPTVNTRDRMVKGSMFDDDGEAARTYLGSADLRGLAAACNEVADWLDARAGGWIEWKGGECPIKAGEKFEVRLANGSECIGDVSPEGCWSHDAPFCERIIAYRVVTPAEQMGNRLEAFSLGMDRAAIDCAIRAAEELTAQRDGLLVALRDLELGANTVVGCYDRNPGNFAAALADLKRYAVRARAALASVKCDVPETDADADGWVEWNGGECPLPGETLVGVKFECGHINRCAEAGQWDWAHGDATGYGIVAYRVVQGGAS